MVTLRTALGDYAVFEALRNGSVAIDGVTFDFPEFPAIIPEFRKMCRTLDYDVCEMSLGCYFAARDHGRPFTAIPAIALQQPQHRNVVYNSKSGIQRARDLEGTRVGLRGYTVTSGIWGRGILAMDYGLDHTKVNWVPSDDEHVSESNALLPANVTPSLGADVRQMLEDGDLAAGLWASGTGDHIKPLIENPEAAERAFVKRYGVFPLNHMVVIKDSILDANPGIAEAIYDACKRSKAAAFEKDPNLHVGGAGIKQDDPLPYGLTENRKSLDMFLDFCADQRVTTRRMTIEELFPLGLD